jgi:hypothetical protein
MSPRARGTDIHKEECGGAHRDRKGGTMDGRMDGFDDVSNDERMKENKTQLLLI